MKNDNSGMIMTEGKILPLLVKFTIPIMLSGFLQQFYGAMDSVVVGRFTGQEALGAVGATASLTNLILSVFIGMSTGAGIVIAQLIGAEDESGIKKAVHTSVALSLVCGIFLTGFGCMMSGRILALMNTPEDIFPLAREYMFIYFLGSVPSLIYNFGSGILRASGDSKRPLYYLFAATVVNIVFNLIFVIVFRLGVKGVAISTVISQTVSAVLVSIKLITTETEVHLNIRDINFDGKTLKRILKIGLPAGLQGSVFSFSNTVIQSTVNSFGKAVVAGCTASSGIENFVYITMNSVSLAETTYIGQNYGAGKIERCHKGFKISVALVTLGGIFLGAMLVIFKRQFIELFIKNSPETVAAGMERLTDFGYTYFLCGIMDVLCGAMRGYGDSFSPMIMALIGVTGSRMLWIFTVLPFKREVFVLFLAFPISWLVTIIPLLIKYRSMMKKMRQSDV